MSLKKYASALFAVSLLTSVCPIFAASVNSAEEGINLRKIGKVSQALEILEPLAKQGNPVAQCALAEMYESGEGVVCDTKKAMDLYQEAAASEAKGEKRAEQVSPAQIAEYEAGVEKGDAGAMFRLGYLYAHGSGVPYDLNRAVELYIKSAYRGLPEAQNALGFMYQYGLGVRKDSAKAFALYQQASEKGLAGAQNNLGYMYAQGDGGVTRNYVTAFAWFSQAAMQHEPHALCNLGWLYQEGKGVKRDPQLAAEYYTKSAAYGLEAAKYQMNNQQQVSEKMTKDGENLLGIRSELGDLLSSGT